MSGAERLQLQIDVLDQRNQQALTLPNLLPHQLISAIVDEFQDLEYLSTNPHVYQLVRLTDRQPLADELPIGEQLGNADGIALVERDAVLPAETVRPSRPLYLRETLSGQVLLLQWLPAIIGRRDPTQRHNDRVAVSLEDYRSGLRVSRRHLQIFERSGQFFIHSLAIRNPAYLRERSGSTRAIMEEAQPLHHGDTIVLERSDIALRFIVRTEEHDAALHGRASEQENAVDSAPEEGSHE